VLGAFLVATTLAALRIFIRLDARDAGTTRAT
jgi:hypothetical protein